MAIAKLISHKLILQGRWAKALSPAVLASFMGLSAGVALAEESGWIKGHTARLQTLDKITARIATIDIPVGAPMQYGSLEMTIHICTARPPTMAPEHAALIEIKPVDHHDIVADEPIFKGWMFASSPGLNALEHPVYDVSVLACIKD